MSSLLTLSDTDERPEAVVRRSGRVLDQFDHRTQDSGNVSWVVETDDGTYFVKTAGTSDPAPPGAPVPYFDHRGRVELLRTAIELAASCSHPCLARLRNVIETPLGPALVYDYAPGELIGTTDDHRRDPCSAYQRFAHLPEAQLLGHFDTVIGLHRELGAAGWVACDLYDGSMLVDFARGQLTVVDLDSYRRGPSTNTMGRMFGSTRFMAPEELELGAPIDQRTTVFTLGRLVWHFGTRLSEQAVDFCGSRAVREVIRRATAAERNDRHATVDEFATAWGHARRRRA